MQRPRALLVARELVGLENSSPRVSCLWVRGGSFRVTCQMQVITETFFSLGKQNTEEGG